MPPRFLFLALAHLATKSTEDAIQHLSRPDITNLDRFICGQMRQELKNKLDSADPTDPRLATARETLAQFAALLDQDATQPVWVES